MILVLDGEPLLFAIFSVGLAAIGLLVSVFAVRQTKPSRRAGRAAAGAVLYYAGWI